MAGRNSITPYIVAPKASARYPKKHNKCPKLTEMPHPLMSTSCSTARAQAGLPYPCSHAPAQPAHHLGHGQHRLHRRISIRGHFLELPHSSLRFNLIWFLHWALVGASRLSLHTNRPDPLAQGLTEKYSLGRLCFP